MTLLPAPQTATETPREAGGQVPPQAPRPSYPHRLQVSVILFAALFGTLLASYPARNLDFWQHLASGRDLLRGSGNPDQSWLYDIGLSAANSVGCGALLVALKALLCGAVAALMMHLTRPAGWRVALAVIGLAVLAVGSRVLLQPATISIFFLALTFWLLQLNQADELAEMRCWPGWRLVVLFVIWANVDARFVLGLGVVALAWIGRWLDGGLSLRRLGSVAAALGVLVVVSCISPEHVKGYRILPELRSGASSLVHVVSGGSGGEAQGVNSPFERDYLRKFQESPAALAYYPLLALSLLSIVFNWKRCRWSWLLPWVGLVAVSAMQARLIPFFAVAAGPITAWNLEAFFASREAAAPTRPRVRYATASLAILLAVAFLVAAWPGWLQAPPFEPRRWSVETPAALKTAAEFLKETHAAGLWAKESKTLHTSADVAGAFRWFCPEDQFVLDDELVKALVVEGDLNSVRGSLRNKGISRVVAYEGNETYATLAVLDRLLGDPVEWPLLSLRGGVAVFGWRDPARSREGDPFRGKEVDFTRLAYRPEPSERAPGEGPHFERQWWEAFWKSAPPLHPPGRDEATLLLRKANALIQSSPVRHQEEWITAHEVGLIGAAGGWGWSFPVADAAIRGALIFPPMPENPAPGTPPPAITQIVFAYQKEFALDRGYAPAGVLYSAVRAARRAVAESPTDASSYFTLGRTYAMLVRASSEQGWTKKIPDLMRLRQVQASAALNRAVALNPRHAQAHLELSRLYLTINYLDLAAEHLRAYVALRPPRGDSKEEDKLAEERAAELNKLTKEVEQQTREFRKEGERFSVVDRATMALRRGLAGQARELLLKSHFSAFGIGGMEMELDLLLRSGRAEEVLRWTGEEEQAPLVKSSLGDYAFHWTRAQAHLALGDYDAADLELGQLCGPGSGMSTPRQLGDFFGGLLAKALLDDQPGSFSVARIFAGGLSRQDIHSQIEDLSGKIRPRLDLLVLRGLASIEAGEIERARASLRMSLEYSRDPRGESNEFRGVNVATDLLSLIEDVRLGPLPPP